MGKRNAARFVTIGRTEIPQPRRRQDPAVQMMMDRLGEDSPLFGAVALELMLLRRLGTEITQDVMARVLDKVEAAHREQHAIAAPTQIQPMRRASRGRFRNVQVDGAVVYYMRIGNRVKIGTSTNLAKRLQAINPEELMAVESGGADKERIRHEQFAALRTHGEWFRLEPPLTDHIAEINGVNRG